MIEIKNLSKKFNGNEVLKNINISFARGKVCGIVGENGAGKSTLFNCILGLEACKGSVSSDFKHLKNHTGFLPTSPHFISKLTAKEYLQLMINSRDIIIDKLDENNFFDLPFERYASEYSTGMKKKLALNGILLQQNEVFIFDEPFSGVDMQSNFLIKEIILELSKQGKYVILSSHIFNILSEISDVIHVLKDGIIQKSVNKKDFESLEQEMKLSSIGNKINQINNHV